MIKRLWGTFLIGVVCATSMSVGAQTTSDDAENFELYSNVQQEREYYTIDESQKDDDRVLAFEAPNELIGHLEEDLQSTVVNKTLSLLKWIRHDEAPAEPTVPYKRKRHFGSWIREKNDDTCYNTRAKVLIRDSRRKPTFTEHNKCVVDKGLWKDPYTGQIFDSSRQIQIDHVVPLKNAYISGASKWVPSKRCLYANFTADIRHLMSVSGTENMRKGDRSPADYIPPNEEYTCQYLENWLKIKLVWGLFMRAEEVVAIEEAMKERKCTPKAMRISRTEVATLRDAMLKKGACASFSGDAVRSTQSEDDQPFFSQTEAF